jgi:hypothetical protein
MTCENAGGLELRWDRRSPCRVAPRKDLDTTSQLQPTWLCWQNAALASASGTGAVLRVSAQELSDDERLREWLRAPRAGERPLGIEPATSTLGRLHSPVDPIAQGRAKNRCSLGRTGSASASESDSQSDSQSDGLPWTGADEYGQQVVADVYALDCYGRLRTSVRMFTKPLLYP